MVKTMESKQRYILKNKDIPLIEFQFTEHINPIDNRVERLFCIEILKIYDENKNLLPKGLNVDCDSETIKINLYEWLLRRKAPIERKNMEKIIEFMGNKDNPVKYIHITRGLSLNDAYWVPELNDHTTWEQCNLYKNPFDDLVSEILFEGDALKVKNLNKNRYLRSPEPTSSGMLRKCWVRKANNIFLRKAEEPDKIKTDGRSSIIMEFLATQVAHVMELEYTPYYLSFYTHKKGDTEIVCECPIFTSEDVGFIDAWTFIRDMYPEMSETDLSNKVKDMDFHVNFARKFGYDTYADMIIFDSIILNTDRHFGNFGYLINNNTGEYLRPAPLFDNGNSLLVTAFPTMISSAVKTYLSNPIISPLGKYFKFEDQAKRFVEQRHIPILERLRTFQFSQPELDDISIDVSILDAMSKAIQIQSQKIIDLYKKKINDTKKKIRYK